MGTGSLALVAGQGLLSMAQELPFVAPVALLIAGIVKASDDTMVRACRCIMLFSKRMHFSHTGIQNSLHKKTLTSPSYPADAEGGREGVRPLCTESGADPDRGIEKTTR